MSVNETERTDTTTAPTTLLPISNDTVPTTQCNTTIHSFFTAFYDISFIAAAVSTARQQEVSEMVARLATSHQLLVAKVDRMVSVF